MANFYTFEQPRYDERDPMTYIYDMDFADIHHNAHAFGGQISDEFDYRPNSSTLNFVEPLIAIVENVDETVGTLLNEYPSVIARTSPRISTAESDDCSESSGGSTGVKEDKPMSEKSRGASASTTDNTSKKYATSLAKKSAASMRFEPWQLEALRKKFKTLVYLMPEERLALADNLQLSQEQVRVWFQNRRNEIRRRHKLSTKETKKNKSKYD